MIYDEINRQVLEENIVKRLMSLIDINATFIFSFVETETIAVNPVLPLR